MDTFCNNITRSIFLEKQKIPRKVTLDETIKINSRKQKEEGKELNLP